MREIYESRQFDDNACKISLVLLDWILKKSPELTTLLSEMRPKIAGKRRSDLWKERLFLNYVVRTEGSEQKLPTSYFEFLGTLPEITIPSLSSLVITARSAWIDSDLSVAWHPDLTGYAIEAVERDSISLETISIIERAMALLGLHPSSRALVENHCRAICVVNAVPELTRGQCISLCSKSVPGVVFLSAAPTILTAESVVHESAHQMLYAIEELHSLVRDEAARVVTPLRPDARPVSGLLHQTWVLWHLIHFYRVIVDANNDLVKANRSQICKRLDKHMQDYHTGYGILCENREALTPRGEAFVQEWFGNERI